MTNKLTNDIKDRVEESGYSEWWFVVFWYKPFALVHADTQPCLVEICLHNNPQARGSDFGFEQRRFARELTEFPNHLNSHGERVSTRVKKSLPNNS